MNAVAYKSKTLTAGLAMLFGTLGLHRFYLYGPRDRFGWAHIVGSACGVAGWGLLVTSDLQSPAGWGLTILGGISLFSAFLAAIVYGLRPDERWDAQFNADTQRKSRSGWIAVIIVSLSLFVGAMLLMVGLAVAFQTYFETHDTPNRLSQ
ncbi:membrane protein [Pandoraea eparura]|uniref:Membrane protein n=1 Tax=Pandoraea eparura TaxID=2508291 RepID=A0A5E4UXN8_9BURK|nr:TM2 domain-containing protein [Pandoraea eparura]VVE04681.1 membrane protein [Pandoraea eparura]